MGPSWGNYRNFRSPLGVSWGPLVGLGGPLVASWRPSIRKARVRNYSSPVGVRNLSPLEVLCGRSWGVLGSLWDCLGGLLGSYWGSLGRSWSHLEASEAHRKRKGSKAKNIEQGQVKLMKDLGILGTSFGDSLATWIRLRSTSWLIGGMLDAMFLHTTWAILRHRGGHLGASGATLEPS